MLAKGEGAERTRWLDGINDSMRKSEQTSGDSGGERALAPAVHGAAKSQTE